MYRKSLTAFGRKYLLRPLTKRMKRERLYATIQAIVPPMIPVSRTLRKWLGKAGGKLVPIVEYSHLGLPQALNAEWAVLDTFDMYSPAHDHPQTLGAVQGWFDSAGLEQVLVRRGPNGIVGKGLRPGGRRPEAGFEGPHAGGRGSE